jgi:DNA-binding NtrC family response regulator
MMPGPSGIELMGAVREDLPHAAFILLTGHGTIENATQAMREGAYDYLTKPVDLTRLKVVLEKAVERVSDREELLRLTRDLAEHGKYGRLVGRTPIMQDVYRLVGQAAPSRVSVLVTGESGTGKEVVARTLHEMSPRRHKPFVAVNCAAIPQSLLESEILGHQKGSFTGATADRAGCFELATGGTLLLDEIGEMPPELQAKLLRVLEERTIRRVGGRQEIPVDVRVISSTNADIGRALQSGRFREDLFYRLNVFTIALPALRERPQDVPLLAQHFLHEFASANGKAFDGFTPEAQDTLRAHRWPGNVRELRNVVERAVVVATGSLIDVCDLPSLGPPPPARTEDAPRAEQPAPLAVAPAGGPSNGSHAATVVVSVGSTVEEAEEMLILETLRKTGDNKTRAAEILGISTRTLHNKLRKYRGRPA